jgi:hypothetical protein
MVMILVIAASVNTRAAGTAYQVTLQGSTLYAPQSTAGDPLTIQFTVDSTDLIPDNHNSGKYSASDALATLPHATIGSSGDSYFQVVLNTSGGLDRAVYTAQDYDYLFVAAFNFPAGTLASDAFPSTLPLGSATSTEWLVHDLAPLARGTFTSYSAMAVPEGGTVLWLISALGLLRRRRRA